MNQEGGSTLLQVIRAEASDAQAWDEFVNQHPEGRYSQLWGYRTALEQCYGYHCVYLKIMSDGKLCGVFPSIKRSRHGGWLISQPFCEYGGTLTVGLTPDQHRETTRLLLNAAREEGCRSIEIRGGIGCEDAAAAADWAKQPLHSYAVLNLEDPEILWRKALTNEARKGVNKAKKSGLTTEIRCGAAAIQTPFFEIYLDSMKRLGVPPHAHSFFTHLAEGIGERLVASWVMKDSRPAAILLGATSSCRVHIFVIASDPNAWSMRPSDLAHWELISWACRQGFKAFDFGSARYAGQIQFKKKWGVALYDYGFYLIAPPELRSKLKIETVKTSSGSMSFMSDMWRRFVPLPLTQVMGPPIRRFLTK